MKERVEVRGIKKRGGISLSLYRFSEAVILMFYITLAFFYLKSIKKTCVTCGAYLGRKTMKNKYNYTTYTVMT